MLVTNLQIIIIENLKTWIIKLKRCLSEELDDYCHPTVEFTSI